MQAVLFALIVFFSGTPRDINKSAEDRFENSLLTAVSLVDSRIQTIKPDFTEVSAYSEKILSDVLNQTRWDLETLMADDNLKASYISNTVPAIQTLIEENDAAGGFIILSNSNSIPERGVNANFPGVNLYNAPLQNGERHLVGLRGDERVLRRNFLPQSVNWLKYYIYNPAVTELDWMFEPMIAAEANPGLDINDLAYWSFPFYLYDHSIDDSFTAICVPIRTNGKVIGTMGIVYMTSDLLATNLLNRLDNISLMLVSYAPSNGGIAETGSAAKDPETRSFPLELQLGKNIFNRQERDLSITPKYTFDSINIMYPPGSPIVLRSTREFPGLFTSDTLTFSGNPSVVSVSDIPVYPENSIYNDNRWGLAVVADEASVFSLSRRLVTQLVVIMLLALAVTITTAGYISRTLSKGLYKILASMEGADSNRIIPIIDDGTFEITELSERMHDQSLRFSDMMAELDEERRRYYLALINSDGNFIDYDAATDILRTDTLIQDPSEKNLGGHIVHRDIEHFLENIGSGEFCVREDIADVVKFLRGQSSETITVRLLFNSASGKQGLRYVTGKPNHIYDEKTGKLQRTIAFIRDITEEKKNEYQGILDSRRDQTTGFLKPDHTVSAIKDFLTECRVEEYFCVIIFVENYWYFTEKYGRFYSDALITEVARFVGLEFTENNIITRECSNEFLMILPVTESGDETILTADLRLRLLQLLDDAASIIISDEEPERLSLCAGVFLNNTGRFASVANQRAEVAAAAAIKRLKSRTLTERESLNPNAFAIQFYNDVENDYDFTEKVDIYAILEDIRVFDDYYNDSRNLNNFAFNILEKGSDMKSAVQILITRLGNEYGFDAVKVFMFEKNTSLFSCSWEWNKNDSGRPPYNVQITVSEKNLFDSIMYGTNHLLISSNDSHGYPTYLTDGLYISEGHSVAIIPCPADETFIGCVAFEANDEVLEKSDYEQLRSIVKLLTAFIAKQRSTRESRAKSDFLSKMSHEIRTPMNAILGMTEIALGDSDISENQENYLKKIEYSAKYLLTLINDILDISRIESGKTHVEITDTYLDEIILGLRSIIGTQCDAKNISYTVNDRAAYHHIKTDSLKLNQILLNLLGNAVKFTPQGGSITLDVDLTEPNDDNISTITFAVADTGIGIRNDRLKKIFEPFEQEDASTVRQYGGTGLGLAISRNFVTLLDGDMTVDSTVNKGTTFRFSLPVAVVKSDETAKISDNDNDVDFSGKHILIAEDDDLNMEIARTLLIKAGFNVTGVENGELALNTFIDSEPGFYSAILMDIRMPVMSGLTAAERIRSSAHPDAKTVPILALSANAFAEDIQTSRDAGMNDHIIKPLDMRVLLAKLRMYL
jgi:signal transduction histidine kinase/CheY-like chemotaxis protein/GGDEF domain-containing protein